MKAKSYRLDDIQYSIKVNAPFQDEFIKCKHFYDFRELCEIIFTPSQERDFHGEKRVFQISHKKIAKAIERFGRCDT